MTVLPALDAPRPAREGTPPLYPRVLGDRGRAEAGKTLLVVAGLHGNEPAGVIALQRIFGQLESQEVELAGRLIGLAGNRRALAAGRRYLEEDLNRMWFESRIRQLARNTAEPGAEAVEILELDREIRRVLEETAAAGQPIHSVFSLDLHTTSGPGPAFSVLNDTLHNRDFAQAFPVPVVLGLEEELGGTLATYIGDLGVRMLGFESGRHDDNEAVDRAEDAIWIALGLTGLLDRGQHPEIGAAWKRLSAESVGLPHLVEVRYRHAIDDERGFRIRRGLSHFHPIAAGEEIGQDRQGPVKAPCDGMILMPLYQEQGDDGFFLIRRVRPVWLRISTAVRRLRLERFAHWLPGVRRHPDLETTFVVDRRTARWFALELFHLLGFRRREATESTLTVSRRRET